jgi:hypothetical protein
LIADDLVRQTAAVIGGSQKRSTMKACWFCWIVSALLCAGPVARGQSLVGQWEWGAGGGITEIRADGSGRDARNNTLQWAVRDGPERTYTLRWSHGYVDTVTIAADGRTLTGVNQQGLRFSAKRVSSEPPAASPTPPTTALNAIPGRWSWGVGGGTVEIRTDGSGRDGRGNTMQWIVRDASARTFTLRWSHGYTDAATLSADGNSLVVVNNQGTRFTATRIADTGDRAVDLNGTWSKGLLHIWQDGAEVLATASWKRTDGKYVAWRGEGRLQGAEVDLRIRYSPMPHGPEPEWRGRLTVSPDGNTITALYSIDGVQRDTQVYTRDP